REVTYPLGPALGQCCGGSVSVVLERWDARRLASIRPRPSSGGRSNTSEQRGLSQQNRITDEIGLASQNALPTGREGGAGGSPPPAEQPPFIARSLTGGPPTTDLSILPFSARKAAQAIREGHGPALHLNDGWLIEATRPAKTSLYLYGAGHVGRAICSVFECLPFGITLIDDAPERFPNPVPSEVAPLLAKNPADAVATAPHDAIHLVLTYSHALDLEICHRVLSRDFRHVGLIGSATKAARFRRRLAELGHPPERIARLACPIGDRSLGKEPKAIAIGVAAEMIRLSDAVAAPAKDTA
ncbi:MAG: xanthine dehydrogenase accessory protein XdhC, partial [Pseudomonadota bacterium]